VSVDPTAQQGSVPEPDEDQEEDEDMAEQRIAGRDTLGTAIRNYLQTRTPPPLMSTAEAVNIISRQLDILFASSEDKRRQAESILSSGLSGESLHTLALVMSYLTTY